MRTLTFLLALLFSTQALSCPPHKSVSAGDVVPCKGHFFNEPTELRIRTDVRDNELRKKQIELKDLQINQLSTDRDNWKVEAQKQAKLNRSKDNDLRNGVIAGVVMTLSVMFAARQVGK